MDSLNKSMSPAFPDLDTVGPWNGMQYQPLIEMWNSSNTGVSIRVKCTRCGLSLNDYFKKFRWCPMCISHGVKGTLVKESPSTHRA